MGMVEQQPTSQVPRIILALLGVVIVLVSRIVIIPSFGLLPTLFGIAFFLIAFISK